MFVSPMQNSCIVKLESKVIPEVFLGKVQVECHQLSVDHIGRASFAPSQVASNVSAYVFYFEPVSYTHLDLMLLYVLESIADCPP